MFAFVNRGVMMGVSGGNRAAMAEQERRRADIYTYTKPLDMSAGGSEMKEFLTDFYRNVIFKQVEEMRVERERYPDTVGKYYKDLVPSKMNNEDFWQRYYYRCCSLDRINAQLQQQQQQQQDTVATAAYTSTTVPASDSANNNKNKKNRKGSIKATLNASFQNLMASVSSINSNINNNNDKDDIIFASRAGEGEHDDPVQIDFRKFTNTATTAATITNSSIGTGAGEHTKATPTKNNNNSDHHAATMATATGSDDAVIISVKKEDEKKKAKKNCNLQTEENKNVTTPSSSSSSSTRDNEEAPQDAVARKQRRRSSMEQSNRNKNGVLEWTAWKRRTSSSSNGSGDVSSATAAAKINSLAVEGPQPVKRESVHSNIPQEWVNVTIKQIKEEGGNKVIVPLSRLQEKNDDQVAVRAMKDQAKKDQALKETALPKFESIQQHNNNNVIIKNNNSGSSGLAAMAAAWRSSTNEAKLKGDVSDEAVVPKLRKEEKGASATAAAKPLLEESIATTNHINRDDEGSGKQRITILVEAGAEKVVPTKNETEAYMTKAAAQVVEVQKAYTERDIHRSHATLLVGLLVSIVTAVVVFADTAWTTSLLDQLCSPLPPNQVLNINATAGSNIDDVLGVAPWWVPESYNSYKPEVFRRLCGPHRLHTKVSLGRRRGLFSWVTGPNHVLIIHDLNSFDRKPLVLKTRVQQAVLSSTLLEVKIKSGKTEFIPVPWSTSTTAVVGGK